MEEKRIIGPEDYAEPRCLLCGEPYGAEPAVKPVPQKRIIQKMDEYMARRDYAGAERHLLYWLEEAKLGRDERGELMLRNELAGHYRKTGEGDKAIENAEAALALLDKLDFQGTVSAGTTYVNAATVFNAFGDNERSMALFRKAREAYEADDRTDKALLGGLYNNMGLTCAALGHYEEAFEWFDKAMAAMGEVPGGALEQAITCLNIADALEGMKGMEAAEEEINGWLERALELLSSGAFPEDGYCAFVLEKCIPTFSYFGWFLAEKELRERAETIYSSLKE